jgi:hypothetical protein
MRAAATAAIAVTIAVIVVVQATTGQWARIDSPYRRLAEAPHPAGTGAYIRPSGPAEPSARPRRPHATA